VRFVVCGEALIDLVRSYGAGAAGPGTGGHFSSAWQAQSAGSPLNTAVALGRLGNDVQFLGRLSTDAFGQQLVRHLVDCQVALDLACTTVEATSIAVVSLDGQGKAAYSFHFAGTANFGWQPAELPRLGSGDWLHIASLATIVEPGSAVLLDWLTGVQVPISYDINVRPTVIPDPARYWRTVLPWLQICGDKKGLVKASDDDVMFLAQGSPDTASVTSPLEVAGIWVHRLGLERFVVTLGPAGAASVEADGTVVRVLGHHADVVDTVGAGDTFTAGLLDAWAAGSSIDDALARGVAASAIVVTRSGAQPPTRSELDTFTGRTAPAGRR